MPTNIVVSGYFWTAFERIVALVLQFIGISVLSRILTPSDFSIIAIVSVFISLSTIIVDCLGGAIINKKVIFDEDLSTLFWYNVSVSTIAYLIIYIFSNLLSRFYTQPILSSVLKVLGLQFVIFSIGAVQAALLIRELKFKQLTLITVISQLLSVIFGIVFAFLGYGVWSLVYMQLIASLSQSFILIVYRHYRPKLIFSFKSFKWEMHFGGWLLLANVINNLVSNLYLLFIGKVYSTNLTGCYYQSNRLQNVPIGILSTIIDRVNFPILSKLSQVDLFQYDLKISKFWYFITTPIMLLSAALSKPIVNLVLGDQWIYSSKIFQVLCFVGCIQISRNLIRNTLKSLGKTNIILYIEIITLILIFAQFMVCYYLPFIFLLWGNFLISILILFVNIVLYKRYSNLGVIPLIFSQVTYFIISLFVYVIVSFISTKLCLSSAVKLIILFPLGLILYTIICRLLNLKEISFCISLFKKYASNFDVFKIKEI